MLSIEEKISMGKTIVNQLADSKGVDVDQLMIPAIMYLAINGESKDALVEIIGLGVNESVVDGIKDNLLKNFENADSGAWASVGSYKELMKVFGKLTNIGGKSSSAKSMTMQPFNVLLGEAMIKAGNEIIMHPELLKPKEDR